VQFASEFRYGLMMVVGLVLVIGAGILTPIHQELAVPDVPVILTVSNCSSVGYVPALIQSLASHPWATLSGGSTFCAVCAKVDVAGLAQSVYSYVRGLSFSKPAADVILQRGSATAPFRAKSWQQ